MPTATDATRPWWATPCPPARGCGRESLGAAGATLRLVGDGGRELATVAVDSQEFEHAFAVPRSTSWAHAQLYGEDTPEGRQAGCTVIPSDDLMGSFTYCTNRVVMLGLTSAIYFRSAAGDPGAGAGRRPCLARRSPIGARNVGRIRLGSTRRALLALRVRSPRRAHRRLSYCVKGSRGRVTAVFSGRSARARVELVVTTAPGHGNRGIRVGSAAARFRRSYPGRVHLRGEVYAAGPKSRLLFGLRRGRVAFMAVGTRAVVGRPARIRRDLRLVLSRGRSS